MSELIPILPEETFPKEDISDELTDELELLLQNQDMLYESHSVAEQRSSLYRVGHEILVAASRPHVIRHELNAISNGISTYEAISGLASPISMQPYHNTMLTRSHIEMAYLSVKHNFDSETKDLPALFRNHLPNTSKVVETAAERQHGGAVDFAIVGAALAYELDRGAATENQHCIDNQDENLA